MMIVTELYTSSQLVNYQDEFERDNLIPRSLARHLPGPEMSPSLVPRAVLSLRLQQLS